MTEYNTVLHSITDYYRVLQSITEYQRVSQSITVYQRVLQCITKTNLVHLFGPIFGLVSSLFRNIYNSLCHFYICLFHQHKHCNAMHYCLHLFRSLLSSQLTPPTTCPTQAICFCSSRPAQHGPSHVIMKRDIFQGAAFAYLVTGLLKPTCPAWPKSARAGRFEAFGETRRNETSGAHARWKSQTSADFISRFTKLPEVSYLYFMKNTENITNTQKY